MSERLHQAFVTDASKVREALGDMDKSSFFVRVEISGRTLSDADECKITYQVGSNSWGSDNVSGDSIETCLKELMRRLGWSREHAPLALAAPRETVAA